MKCKICRYTTRSLPKMAEHYRKKHPSKMKHHKTRKVGLIYDKSDEPEVKRLIKQLLKKL